MELPCFIKENMLANCNGVGDFEACLDNTDEFCPENIPCMCKGGEPFCRCDYFRIGWKEYWYMGPKCNHLWNTLDFILVATLPGVALVLIVVVIFSAVYCLKVKQPGKQPKSAEIPIVPPRSQPKPPYSGGQQNPAFSTDTAASPGDGHHQPARDAWAGQIPKPVLKREDFNDASIPNQRQNYSPVYAQPLRTADPASDYFPQSRAQRDEFDYPRKDLPYPVYPEARQYRRY
ncbi:uncharacterized protein LOC119695056 isoform X2 [Motacilla alba alba]|uniref:uncharacterized protein LOC119695056 isoform X2 n=1 Tax=Motacilla alba alba TaxID=1094192 RepID=UPI0018D52BC8|nr:uncharacterized protein LOC119695056 isoform X2 [Motacilla alba alba]